MANEEGNLNLFKSILKGRQFVVEEVKQPIFWMEDVDIGGNNMEVIISIERKEGWLEINNSNDESSVKFIPLDGQKGVFKAKPPSVSDIERFKFERVYGFDEESQKQKTKTESAGACDCLLLDVKWRFFEFKTKADSIDLKQADVNRTKAKLQLARTLTFFREQAAEKAFPFDSDCECIMVTNPFFPKITASNISQAVQFFREFQAPLIEVKTDQVYLLS
jgi:hypothetical protein